MKPHEIARRFLESEPTVARCDARRALLLRHLDGLAGPRLARALGKSPSEIRRVLDHAQKYVRQRLMESGCRFSRSAAA